MKPELQTLLLLLINRASEKKLHLQGKLALALLFSSRRFMVLFERRLADLVAFRRTSTGMRVVCGEHDTTVRTVARNVRRDFANGCNSLVILVQQETQRAAIRRLISREFSDRIQHRTGIITYEDCDRQLKKLSIDFESLAGAVETHQGANQNKLFNQTFNPIFYGKKH